MNCSSCGKPLPANVRFCPSCGAAAPPASEAQLPGQPAPTPAAEAAAPPPTMSAPPPAPSAVAAAPASRPSTSSLSRLQPLEWGAIAGLALAVLATFLAWVKISAFGLSESASAWNGDLRGDLRIGHWLGTPESFPTEALVIIALAVAGIYLVAAPLTGRSVPVIPYGLTAIGVALVLIGVLNYLYIDDQLDSAFDDIGAEAEGLLDAGISTGVYVLILGGLVTAVCGYLLEQKKKVSPGAP